MTTNTTMQSIRRWFSKETESAILNEAAFTNLYEETYLTVFRYVYGLSNGHQQEAEDLTAETYARAWKQRHSFQGHEQAALGWLLQIARNLVIDLARRRKTRGTAEDLDVELLIDPGLLPETDIMTREQVTTLWHLLGGLAEEVREILVLRYMLGWQVRQIAAHLGMAENTVSVTIRRALKRLQHDWNQAQENNNE